MRPSLPIRRILALGIALAALAACGRRGPLEAPPDPAAVRAPAAGAIPAGRAIGPGQAVAEDDGEPAEAAVLPSPVPTPARPGGRKRGYVVPKDPFILDPLL
jgi:predicted small lipoprotein YifL